MNDLNQLLEEVKREAEIKERERATSTSPSMSSCLRVGSDRWQKRTRELLKKERKLSDMEIERELARRKSQARYHQKNKARLNQRRIERARLPRGTYNRARRRAERRGQEWDISFDDWWDIWYTAPRVFNPQRGFMDSAWNQRGGNYVTDIQLTRLDTERGWTLDNVVLARNGTPIHEL